MKRRRRRRNKLHNFLIQINKWRWKNVCMYVCVLFIIYIIIFIEFFVTNQTVESKQAQLQSQQQQPAAQVPAQETIKSNQPNQREQELYHGSGKCLSPLSLSLSSYNFHDCCIIISCIVLLTVLCCYQ